MKIISYYKSYSAKHLAMARRRYWHHAVADDLMAMFDSGRLLVRRAPGRNSHDVRTYEIESGHFDIAYLELFDLPVSRPADFVWASIGDFLGLESELEAWLDWVRPNLLVTRQYYDTPLLEMCEKYGCKCLLRPQFIDEPRVYHSDKKYLAMLTGTVGPIYRLRVTLAQILTDLNDPDILVSTTRTHTQYPLDTEDYQDRLRHTKFVFSTGIYDVQMPPKHIEVCNYGACLVSPVLPWMELCGFKPDVHYIPIISLGDIPKILQRTDYNIIAKAGQDMVQRQHTIQAWYNMVLAEYQTWKGLS